MDSLITLKTTIDSFADERDWTKFHTPANLAKSISIEANGFWNASNGMKMIMTSTK